MQQQTVVLTQEQKDAVAQMVAESLAGVRQVVAQARAYEQQSAVAQQVVQRRQPDTVLIINGRAYQLVPTEQPQVFQMPNQLPAQVPAWNGGFPDYGVEVAPEGNMITNTLGSVNDGLKTAADTALGLIGGVLGMAIDVVTLGQGRKR